MGQGCLECIDFANGQRASKPQRALAEMLGAHLNERVDTAGGTYHADLALRPGREEQGVSVTRKVCIEYDSWYWHAHRQETDRQRDEVLLEAGWHVLRVRSGEELPGQEEVVGLLAALESEPEPVRRYLDLEDWGRGPTLDVN